ncbi:hypothetical protein KAU09_01140 [Candidatus Parcubacteria bacterium]|nr:hypothetical protein [Candidatus Parcubacteria bacterium]
MSKIKKQKKYLAGILVVLIMIAMYGFIPLPDNANAVDAISDAKDTISDSDVSKVANHTFDFTTGTSTAVNGYIEVTFPTQFGTSSSANVTCPAGAWTTTLSNGDRTIRCTSNTVEKASGTKQILINSVTNPDSEAARYIEISHYDSGNNILERVSVAVAIIEDILMTARVDSTLTFTISGTSTEGVVDGIPCSNISTATNTPFGTLAVDATSTVCQTLNVTTNADDGYTVTVEQDDELTSDSDSNINSFNNSPNETGSTTPEAWVSPTNTLDAYHTYGHMGLHTDDSDLNSLGGYDDFSTNLFAGLNTTDPMPVMHHDGPSDGYTYDKGEAHIIYQAEIGSLQEAGDYENTLTYICTPTF